MKIIFITQLLPYPVNSGGKLKTFNILKILAKKNDVYVVSFHDNSLEDSAIISQKLNISVKSFFWPLVTQDNTKSKIVVLRSLFKLKPFRVYKYFNKNVEAYIQNISQVHSFDVIYLDHITSFQYLSVIKRPKQARVIYDEHNINSLAMWRKSLSKDSLIEKSFFAIDALKNYIYEKKILKSVDHTFSISDVDKKHLISRGASVNNTSVLPVPIKPIFQYKYKTKNTNIVFVGLLSWPPNINGIIWFSKKVFPLITKIIPDVKLYIVGPKPDRKILNLAKKNQIIVTGEVKRVESLYKKSNVCIAPILEGSGIRIKILSSMAYGIPTVSTTIGAEGIPCIKDKNICIADNPEEFAKDTIRLLTNKNFAIRISQQGVKLIKQYFSEKQAKTRFNLVGIEA